MDEKRKKLFDRNEWKGTKRSETLSYTKRIKKTLCLDRVWLEGQNLNPPPPSSGHLWSADLKQSLSVIKYQNCPVVVRCMQKINHDYWSASFAGHPWIGYVTTKDIWESMIGLWDVRHSKEGFGHKDLKATFLKWEAARVPMSFQRLLNPFLYSFGLE